MTLTINKKQSSQQEQLKMDEELPQIIMQLGRLVLSRLLGELCKHL